MAPQIEMHGCIRFKGDDRQTHDVFVVFDGKGFEAPERFPNHLSWHLAKRSELETQSPAGAAS